MWLRDVFLKKATEIVFGIDLDKAVEQLSDTQDNEKVSKEARQRTISDQAQKARIERQLDKSAEAQQKGFIPMGKRFLRLVKK